MGDTKSTTPALPTRYVHEIAATRDKPADTHIHYTTKGSPVCPVDGAAMTAADLPTAEERRAAAADAKSRTRGTTAKSRS